MLMRILLFLAGSFLSITAAYYSIVGLTEIFTGATVAIFLMGASLEFAKLVCASWLYRNWSSISVFIRTYMTTAVVVLMFITSMGIFGFLSKAHLENNLVTGADVTAEYEALKSEIETDQKIVTDIDKQLEMMNATVKEDYNVLRRQNALRREMSADKKAATERLRENNKKLAQINLEVKKIEVEVGPLKYIADMVYGQDEAKNHLDSAVRLVILLLIFVFDPLAVMLLIAAGMKIKSQIQIDDDGNLKINPNDVLHLEKDDEN